MKQNFRCGACNKLELNQRRGGFLPYRHCKDEENLVAILVCQKCLHDLTNPHFRYVHQYGEKK